MKISELIAELQSRLERHGDLDVLATWEGIEEEISVYRGRILQKDDWKLFIDSDSDFYRSQFEHPDDRPANSSHEIAD